MRRVLVEVVAPLVLAIILFGLNYTETFERLELASFDTRFHMKPNIEESELLTYIDIDENSLQEVGRWPWPREEIYKGLTTLSLFQPKMVLLDIEFTEDSPLMTQVEEFNEVKIFLGYTEETPIRDVVNDLSFANAEQLNIIYENLDRLRQILAQYAADPESIPRATNTEEAREIANSLDMPPSFNNPYFYELYLSQNDVYDRISQLNQNLQVMNLLVQTALKNHDLLLAEVIEKMGNVYLTVRFGEKVHGDDLTYNIGYMSENEAGLQYVLDHFSFPNDINEDAELYQGNTLYFPIDALVDKTKGVGFTDFPRDVDGTVRRIELFREFIHPPEGRPDLTIEAIKEYNHRLFAELSTYPLLNLLEVDEEDIQIEDGMITLYNAVIPGESDPQTIRIPLDSDNQMIINWADKTWTESFHHVSFFQLITYYNIALNYQNIFDNEYPSAVDAYETEIGLYQQRIDAINACIENSENNVEECQTDQLEVYQRVIDEFHNRLNIIRRTQEELPALVKDKICIIGLTAAGTIDIGSTTISNEYPLVSTRANIMNTILNQDFLSEVSDLINFTLIMAIMLAFVLAALKLQPIGVTIMGISTLIAFAVFNVSIMVFMGYIFLLNTPIISIAAGFLIITINKYLMADKEKRFIKEAFGQYLSPVVIDQIIENPTLLKLGGERRTMTAFFSDIEAFSTVSEKMKPEELVPFLNEYLTEMTDIILKYDGTVDKYEGDAIIAFWGAPIPIKDHAYKTCYVAVEMQHRMEALRKKWQLEGKFPLKMRIGINTGPMVVGNMGSKQRMDYTMMGDSVNLAARLEGVNKLYSTYTVISDSTYNEVQQSMFVRELDTIRVVGKEKPVIIYELIATKGHIPQGKQELVQQFSNGIVLYKQKEFEKAIEVFQSILERYPDDGPSKLYIERCQNFIQTPPPKDWDGVYSMQTK